MQNFVPDDFVVPVELCTDAFTIRPLTIHDVVRDFDAVVTSLAHLRGIFGPDDPWPPADLSLEQDLIDLGWHQREFQRRRSFAYTVMSPDAARCLGCVYVEPPNKVAHDAQVFLWVRQSEAASGLDERLFATVKQWLAQVWCVEAVAFPGREITWSDWAALPNR